MKILTVGDPHWKPSNITIMPLFEKELVRVMQEQEPDVVVFLGDMLDRHELINSDIMNQCHDFILRLRNMCEIIVLVGNHDLANNRCYLEPRHAFNMLKKVKNVTVVDNVFVHPSGVFAAMPYVPPNRFNEAVQLDTVKDCKVLFCHQEFQGASFNGVASAVAEKYPKDFPLGISGHIHKRQILQSNFIYTGTPFQQDFGDSDEKTISLFTVDGDNIKEKRFSLCVPRRISLRFTADEIKDWKKPEGNDLYRVVVTCQCNEWVSYRKSVHYKELMAAGVKVVPETTNVSVSGSGNKTRKNYLELLQENIEALKDPIILEEFNSILSL